MIVADSEKKESTISTLRPTKKPAVLATGIEIGLPSPGGVTSAVSEVVGPEGFWLVRLRGRLEQQDVAGRRRDGCAGGVGLGGQDLLVAVVAGVTPLPRAAMKVVVFAVVS